MKMKTKQKKTGHFLLTLSDFSSLFSLLQKTCDELYGPKEKDGAIGLEKLASFSDLPVGFRDAQQPGEYQLKKTAHASYFDYAVGPHSIKNILHPAKQKIWEANTTTGGGLTISEVPLPAKKIGFWGIRSCDVEAIKILDKVFLESGFKNLQYDNLRKNLVILTATCSVPSSVCFCTSMGHGPRAASYDINVTELFTKDGHSFVAHAGSRLGQSLLEQLQVFEATASTLSQADQVYRKACQKIKKRLNTEGLPSLLANNLDSPHWDTIAKRCLSCGNCTMVCPTCFCTTTIDTNDLKGDHSDRWLQWDSCFNADFSYIHGGNIRKSTKSRYRQWLTHKLSSWHDQFGQSGCVGCGRCVAWCPVKIDLTEEIKNLGGSNENHQ